MGNAELGKLLYERRKALGLTLEQVAGEVGLNRSSVLRWENGETKDIKRKHIVGISRALQLPIEVLLGDDTVEIEDADITKKRMEVNKLLKQIQSVDNLKLVEKYIKVFILNKDK